MVVIVLKPFTDQAKSGEMLFSLPPLCGVHMLGLLLRHWHDLSLYFFKLCG